MNLFPSLSFLLVPFLGFFAVFSGVPLLAETLPCPTTDKGIERVVATASTWSNLRNSEGSLKYETGRLLAAGLPANSEGSVVLSSIPSKFLESYTDQKYCKEKYEETRSAPITYKERKFSNLDELQDWIGKFSQGDGKDGKDLYNKCDRSCSPQYKYRIQRLQDASYKVDAEAVCGPARDKDDNNYELVMDCG